jgi:transposase-like protein
MANTNRDADREAFWRRTLRAFAKSGLSVREFCHREKVRESAFYFWRRTLRERGLTQRGTKPRSSKPPAFVPLVLRDATSTATDITLELRGGRSLRFSDSFPVDRLAALVLALEAAEDRP